MINLWKRISLFILYELIMNNFGYWLTKDDNDIQVKFSFYKREFYSNASISIVICVPYN